MKLVVYVAYPSHAVRITPLSNYTAYVQHPSHHDAEYVAPSLHAITPQFVQNCVLDYCTTHRATLDDFVPAPY